MRRRTSVLIRRIGILMVAVMMLASPLSANAAAGVKYVYNDKDNPTNRTGIQSVLVDGKTYYDIYDGKSTRGTTEDRIRFLKDVIQSKPEGSDKSVLESWAQLATNIFNRHAYIAAQQHEGKFENNFLNEIGERAGYAYLPKRLAALQKWEKGERDRDDYTIATGLKMANSLNEVRTETAQSLIEPINTSYSANDILKNTNGDATLDALKDDKDQDVLYNLVTCIDQTGQTPKFTYTVFGMAFYDFQLHPLTAEGLEYITAAEGYDSLEQAAQSGVKGVTYITPADSQNTVVSYFENGAEKEATASMQFSQSDSVSVSNSLENTTSYTYTETIGSENKLAATLGIFAETVLKLEFAAQQAISTAYSEEKSISKSKTNDISAEIELPAHTAAAIESSDGSASVTIDYNCPVVVTYKVAIFSLSGDIYQDLVWTKSMSTARYSQGYLQTVFGSKSVKGGMTAQENLYNRAIKYADTSSYEDVYGQTYGWKDMHQDNASATTMRGLDWSGILDGQGLSEADIIKPTVNIKVECYEVDEEGNVLDDKPFNSYTYGGKGYWEYTMPVTAVEKYPNLDKKNFDYTIFTGKTDPGVESTLDNEGRDPEINAGLTKNKSSGLWQKEFTPTHDPTTGDKLTTVKFYYTKSATAEDSTDSSISGKTNGSETVVSDTPSEGLKGINKYVEKLVNNYAMSAAGGTLSYDTKSINSRIKDIVPMYPLASTKLNSYAKRYNMTVGDEIDTDMLLVDGYNKYDVPYYGFDQDFGHWELVDENQEKVTDENVATIDTDKVNGNQHVKATGEGRIYLKYMIDEDVYTSRNESKPMTNNRLESSAIIRIDVSKKLFAGRVEAEGTLESYVGDPAIDLNNSEDVEASVYDKTGKEIEGAIVTWESEKASGKGITIENNKLSFTKAKDYKIRVRYDGGKEPIYSDWITVTAKKARELNKVDIADNKNVLKEFILNDGDNEVNLSDLDLVAKDQYDNDWTDLKDVKWYVNDNEIQPDKTIGIDRYLFKATKAGEYKIYAKCDGVKSNELTLTVKEARKADKLAIADSKDVLKTFVLNDGDNKVKLSELDVTAKDQYNADWDPKNLKWFVNDIEVDPEYAVPKAGEHKIYAKCDGVKSNELTLTVKEARKTDKLAIADSKGVLKTFVLNDGDNKVKLSELDVTAKDQYNADWDPKNLKWFVNDIEVDSEYTVPDAGEYKIYAKCDGVKSNELTLTVKEARKLASLQISDDSLSVQGLDVDDSYDLSKVKVVARDQHGDAIDFDKLKKDSTWSTGGEYSKVDNSGWKLDGVANGSDSLKLTVGDIESNTIDFNIITKPVVDELFSSESSYIREGQATDLKDLKLTAKDQKGNPYELSDEEIASLKWELSEDPKGTIDDQNVTLDKEGRTITVKKGTLAYGETGSVILKATMGDEEETAKAVQVNVNVCQEQVLDSLVIAPTESAKKLTKGDKVLLKDYFDVKGLDQYKQEFSLDDVELTWASDDASFKIEDNNKLVAVKSGGKANITVSAKNSLGKTVTSNQFKLGTDGVRTIQKIELTEVPKSLALGKEYSLKDLKPVCYDGQGNAYTSEELAAYPASVFFTFEKGDTKASLDTSSYVLKTGNQEGYITVTAMAVNSNTDAISDDSGNKIVTKARIWVGPLVDKVSVASESLKTKGGSDEVTLTGVNLENGMTVALFDADNKVVASAKTSGDASSQSATLNVPQNKNKEAVTYTVKYSVNGSDYFDKPVANVTVDRNIEYLKVGDVFTDGLYAYKVTNAKHDGKGTVKVIGFAKGKSAKAVNIPATAKADYDNNITSYKVTAIGKRAFYKNTKITSVNTGKNVKTVEKQAFCDCKKVTSVVISDSVTRLERKAFFNCFALKSLTIGKGITKIEAHSFCNATKLSKIVVRTTKLKTVEGPHIFIKVKKATVYAPAKNIKAYKKMFYKRGLKNAKYKKLK